ncbi:MAG: FliH/SctL family protein [Bacillota bacterium]
MPLSSRVIKGAWVNERDSHQILVRQDLFTAPLLSVDDVSKSDIISNVLETARFQAQDMLDAARVQAGALLAEAQSNIKVLEEEAAQKGYQDGYQAGNIAGREQALGEARQEAEALRAEAREVVKETYLMRQEVLQEIEPQVIDLAIQMTSVIVQRHVEVVPETVMAIARQAFQKLYESKRLTVFAHPDDLILLKSRKQEFFQVLEEGSTIRIIADPAIAQGGCKVETENGDVDATVEGQLRELTHLMRGDEA